MERDEKAFAEPMAIFPSKSVRGSWGVFLELTANKEAGNIIVPMSFKLGRVKDKYHLIASAYTKEYSGNITVECYVFYFEGKGVNVFGDRLHPLYVDTKKTPDGMA